MSQACPEDVPVSLSSNSKILKFIFFPAECQLAGWETRARRCAERSSGSALGGNAGTLGTHVTSTSSPSFWHPLDLHPTSGSPERASRRPRLYGGAYCRPTVWGRKKGRCRYLIPCFRARFSWPARRRETLPITRSRVHVMYIDIPP